MWWAGMALAQPFPGGLPQCQANVNMCSANFSVCRTQLSACHAAAQQFPATGQTIVFHAGDDGDVQAGATLSYTDNGDGTITDTNTKLVWEKKSADGSIHDKDNVYTRDDAFTHVATLNAMKFAGFNDWRVPNAKELQSVVNYQNSNSAISLTFNTNCTAGVTVLNGSCTAADNYWSSSTLVNGPAFTWGVGFHDGNVDAFPTAFSLLRVRAVRGGGNLGSSQ